MKLRNFLTITLVFCLGGLRAQTDTSKFVYRRPLFDFSYDKPVFKLDSQQQANTTRQLRFSAFTGYREGVEPVKREFGFNMSVLIDEKNGITKQDAYNASILELVTHGFAKRQTTILLEVKDPSKYRYLPEYGNKQQWLRKNAWCYELVMPRSAFSVKGIRTVEKDIADFFGIQWGYEMRKVKALVLVRTSTLDKIKSDGTGEQSDGKNGLFKNTGLDWLGVQMDIPGLPPFVDQSGYTDPVDMNLGPIDYADVSAVRQALHRYDLDLKEEVRELKMFVIKEIR